jgi:chromosomal replication initiator protein
VKYYPTVFSLKKIGDELGGRDHSTVIHAKNTVADLLLTDQHFRTLFKTIENKFINI